MTCPPLGERPSREEAIRGFIEDWHRIWEDYRYEEEELLDLGHGVCVWHGAERAAAQLFSLPDFEEELRARLIRVGLLISRETGAWTGDTLATRLDARNERMTATGSLPG